MDAPLPKNCHAGKPDEEYLLFVQLHKNQLLTSGIPQIYWKQLLLKLKDTVFDAGDSFGLEQVEQDEDDVNGSVSISWKVFVMDEQGISTNDKNKIFLIDHAWTYRVNTARQQLDQVPGLLNRMTQLMDIPSDDIEKSDLIDQVFNQMWRFNQCYSLGGAFIETEDALPVWYIMDEFGCRIQHSSTPNFRIVPFLFLPSQMSFSILFPIQDVNCGDEVTRNYLEGPTSDPLTLQALAIPWVESDMTDVICDLTEPDEAFLRSGRVEETYPDLTMTFPPVNKHRKLRVFTDYNVIRGNLNQMDYELTDSEKNADILWLNYHFKDYQDLSRCTPYKCVNQFPFEHILTVKDLLVAVCRRAAENLAFDSETLKSLPKWLPTTFNLNTELPKFVSYFQQREKKGLDNLWICKPWNLARSLDTHITNNLNYILRLPSTGPKIACKYITNPVLFPREDIGEVKFDLRYILLVRSVQPLKVYVYKRFWIRFANKPFSLDQFEDYEKHFTVMNYAAAANLKQMRCDEFMKRFEDYYPNQKWKTIEKDIFSMFKSVFEAATSKAAPSGFAHSPQSRAMYAADIMLEWGEGQDKIEPSLLEINWSPDCQRACQYYPEFFDDVFSTLFLDETNGRHVTLITK